MLDLPADLVSLSLLSRQITCILALDKRELEGSEASLLRPFALFPLQLQCSLRLPVPLPLFMPRQQMILALHDFSHVGWFAENAHCVGGTIWPSGAHHPCEDSRGRH